MLKDIIEVRPLSDKKLYIKFEDGVEGEVKIDDIIVFEGIFKSLESDDYFNKVSLNSETGTIYWPNSADICSDLLYSILTGESIDDILGYIPARVRKCAI